MGVVIGNQMPEAIFVTGQGTGKGFTTHGYSLNNYGAIYRGSSETNTGGYGVSFEHPIAVPAFPDSGSERTVLNNIGFSDGDTSDVGSIVIGILSNNVELFNNRSDLFSTTGTSPVIGAININGVTKYWADVGSTSVTGYEFTTGTTGDFLYLASWQGVADADNPIGTSDGVKIELQVYY